MLTQKNVRGLFNYDAATGVLTWRMRVASHMPAGSRAGHLHSNGLRYVKIERIDYIEAHIIWLWMTGTMPVEVDHEDTNSANNKWANLRLATRVQNSANRNNYRPGKLKWTYEFHGKYQAKVRSQGVMHHVGTFDTEQEAHDAAYAVAQQLHGKFVRR